MIYVDNDSTYSQRIYIPRNDDFDGATGYTITLQRKDYTINQNGLTKIHPDAGFDGISGGTIGVYVSAATGVTFENLDVTENGRYVATGDTVYTGVTVNVPGYEEGYHDGFEAGYSSGYTEGSSNGYDSGYTEGYASGSTDGFNSGYTSGSTDGFASGYTSGTTDGYSSGYTEGFEVGYSSGRTDGIEYQKSLLTDLTATTNGVYTSETGYSGVTVNLPIGSAFLTLNENGDSVFSASDFNLEGWSLVTAHTQVDMTPAYNSGFTQGYASGVTDGQEAQKALLTSATFTQNGIYTRENGWNSVDVDLPLGNTKILIESNTTTELEPPAGFVGFEKVTIITNVTGSTPAVLTGLTATTNNQTYTPTSGVDGFNSVEVAIPMVGVTAGINSSGVYTYSPGDYGNYEGLTSVTVTVDTTPAFNSGYTSGYTEGYASGSTDGYNSGVTYQKSLMTSATFRTNGTYTRADGWDSVTVDVPFTQILTQAQYDALPTKNPNIIYLING